MFPIVLRNIFALAIANPAFAGFAVVNFVVLRLLAAYTFCVILRNIAASCDLVVFWAHSAATFLAGNLLFNTSFDIVIAWFIVAI